MVALHAPTAEPLKFPRGVRFPRPEEIPAGGPPDALARLASAHVTTGYTEADSKRTDCSAYIEANVHADQVWSMVRALAEALLPAVAAPLVGIKGDETVLGPYTDRSAALAVFEPFVEQLQHDGFLEFGIMFQYQGRTEEIFVAAAKYLRVWTNQPAVARTVFESRGVPCMPQLQFIDEFATVSETLALPDGNAGWPVVLDGLRTAFAALPERQPPERAT